MGVRLFEVVFVPEVQIVSFGFVVSVELGFWVVDKDRILLLANVQATFVN